MLLFFSFLMMLSITRGCIVLNDWMIVVIGSDVAFMILCNVIILAFAWRGLRKNMKNI